MRGWLLGWMLCLLASPASAAEDQWLRPSPHSAMVAVRFNSSGVISRIVRPSTNAITGRELTADDPVRIASVSKLVVALAVMRLVDQKKLSLDDDASLVMGRPIRNPAFPDRAITLRQLLSHTSSLTDNADYVIGLDDSIANRLNDQRVWDAQHAPGTWFHYTNFNFPMVATIMERATGERFDALMARLVFKPLKLDACFNWTSCSDAKVARAVTLFGSDGAVRRDDNGGKRPACPVVAAGDGSCDLAYYAVGTNGSLFSPQGGLRISMNDLAKIGRVLLKGGRGFITPASFATMTTPQWRFNGSNGETEKGLWCSYGLAVQTLATPQQGCRDRPFADDTSRIGHPGEAYGLRSGLWVDRKSRTGIAFFVTAVRDDEPTGRSAFTLAEEMILQDPQF